jgi:hypothetical protein
VRIFIFYTPPQIILGIDGKARRKETTWKTKALMGGWDQNGS